MNSIPKTSGIYKIVNITNSKFYVGSTNNFYQRWNSHRSDLRRGVHSNFHLQNAWNMYGEQSFEFQIIEFVMPFMIIEREQYWLNTLNPFGENGYNGNRLADKPPSPKGRIVKQETREKLRIASTGKHNALGRKHTPEEIAKIADSKRGKKRKPFSEEWLNNLSHSQSTRIRSGKQYVVISPDGNEFEINNLNKFCRENGLSQGNMVSVALGKIKHHKKWKCRYA